MEDRDPEALNLSAYHAFFEHSLDAVMYTMPDGRILAANPASCELFGLSEDEILAVGRQGLVDPSDTGWSIAVEERLRTGRVRCELRMRRGDGTTFIADLTSVTFESDSEQRACLIIRDVTERAELLARQARLVEELQHLALLDELTGLRNRRGLGIAADVVLAVADRERVPVQVLFIDVDDMKAINDRYGHDMGDRALQAVGAALSETLRSADIAARVGGDEFVALLHDATVEDAARVARRFTDALTMRRTLGIEAVTASVGIATRQPDDTDLASLLATADRHMYQVKAFSHSHGTGP
jgi:diguanylate cyclase (GGDEF)-like protein/PAS domain S-box-containing protein